MLLRGPYLFMKIGISPLTVSSPVRAGHGDYVFSSSNNGMDFLLPQQLEEERKPRISASSISKTKEA